MEELRSKLIEFKNITSEIRAALKCEDYERLNSLLEKRAELIGHMDSMGYDQEEFYSICSELQIVELNDELSVQMSKKRKELLDRQCRISTGRAANASYNKRFDMDPLFFNKKL